jgi:ElaB/YqjD/DUF883 family membrane-anchored ribosome-binding protein
MSETVTKDKLVADVKEVISDAELLLRETASDLTGRAKETSAKLATKLDAAKVRLRELEGVAREKVTEGAREADRVIREHPYESIGVAFGLGLLIGILLNRK